MVDETLIYFKLKNRRGIHIVKSEKGKVIDRKVVFEVNNFESLKDVCKRLDLDYFD